MAGPGEEATAGPDRKAILALDGGGVRGALSVAFLERIEKLAGASYLADRFDLIGGTSTGAIIGAALALGHTTSDIKDFYFALAPRVFRRSFWRLKHYQTVFDSRLLKQEIDRIVGDAKLDTDALRTAIAIVMKRMDTGSAWIVTNNPDARYWKDPEDGSYIGNRHYRLADLIRASTAAPYYFSPHEIEIADRVPKGLFVDGGITPHNNPSLALFQVATIPAYGFGWPVGAGRLLIVSIGTGTHRPRLEPARVRRMSAVGLAIEALKSLVLDSNDQTMTLMQALGRTDTRWTVNSEIGDLSGVLLPPEPLFTFQRYDVWLERDWLKRELDFGLSDRQLAAARAIDHAGSIPLLYEIGQAAAEKFVKEEHLAGLAGRRDPGKPGDRGPSASNV